jgi:hypothetical protein
LESSRSEAGDFLPCLKAALSKFFTPWLFLTGLPNSLGSISYNASMTRVLLSSILSLIILLGIITQAMAFDDQPGELVFDRETRNAISGWLDRNLSSGLRPDVKVINRQFALFDYGAGDNRLLKVNFQTVKGNSTKKRNCSLSTRVTLLEERDRIRVRGTERITPESISCRSPEEDEAGMRQMIGAWLERNLSSGLRHNDRVMSKQFTVFATADEEVKLLEVVFTTINSQRARRICHFQTEVSVYKDNRFTDFNQRFRIRGHDRITSRSFNCR